MNLHLKKMNTNISRFDKFLEPVVVVIPERIISIGQSVTELRKGTDFCQNVGQNTKPLDNHKLRSAAKELKN